MAWFCWAENKSTLFQLLSYVPLFYSLAISIILAHNFNQIFLINLAIVGIIVPFGNFEYCTKVIVSHNETAYPRGASKRKDFNIFVFE